MLTSLRHHQTSGLSSPVVLLLLSTNLDDGLTKGPPFTCHMEGDVLFCSSLESFPFCRGHQAYLRSGPNYDFVQYRQLVHEITLAFNSISREILQIKGQLEGPCERADLAQHLGRIQEKEKEKLELVRRRNGSSKPLPLLQL